MDSLEALKRILKRERESRKAAEAIIEQKSRELFTLNEQLVALNTSLEGQVAERTQELEEKNAKLKETQAALEEKVQQLKDSNRYKSEFLANMSHELRTPLNSILILARMLSENREGNFTPKQVEYSQVIHNSGQDLLTLINQILDLAKIEAGKVEVHEEEIMLLEIKNNIEDLFFEMARKNTIDFTINIGGGIPKKIWMDKLKVLQILRNLVSNAFKFTEPGGKITVAVQRTAIQDRSGGVVDCLEFSVSDTGIGIAPEKLELIFEAFKQADGSTSRRYGGTGLGLSICKELATLMGGHIKVKSQVGTGSEFKVTLPLKYVKKVTEQSHVVQYVSSEAPEEIPDDRNNLLPVEKPILIVEDDIRFAKILRDYAHNKGHKVIIATQGDRGLHYVREFSPLAVFLDIQLPVVDGWSVLKEIKADPRISAIPVHIFSVIDKQKLGMKMGASSYNVKPITMGDLESIFSKIAELGGEGTPECLIVGDDSRKFPLYYQSVQQYFSNIRYVREVEQAIQLIKENHFGLVMAIGDLKEGMDCPDFLRRMDEATKGRPDPIYYYCLDANPHNGDDKQTYENIHLLSTPQELKDELGITIMEESAKSAAPISPKTSPKPCDSTPPDGNKLKGRDVLLVDDEMRNIFALDSVLDNYGMNIIVANNGKQALEQLHQNPSIELVLMDIMMPVMNGYEAMRAIRSMPKYEGLPIVALTAKAMVGDREKCLEAGATEYVSKPIDVDKLLEVICNLL